MKINAYSNIVRIRSLNIDIDWSEPYKKDSSQSIGTGFFIDKEGHLLTCSHVVEHAAKLLITIPEMGNNEYETQILSIHPELDIALLKTTYKNKSFLDLGNSDKIENGQDVIALGYPLGQSKLKFTKGIVSGLQNCMIQTDTPLNPGNSGGPLLNINGQVIGINTSAALNAENVGYATPIHFFKKLKREFYNKKIIYLPRLGLSLENTPQLTKDFFKLNDDCNTGLYIKKILNTDIYKDSNLKEKDIICQIDNYKLDNKGESRVSWSKENVPLKHILKRYKAHDKVNIHFWSHRDKKYYNEKIRLSSTNNIFKIRKYYPLHEKIEFEIFAGCIFMELTNNHLMEYEGSISKDIIGFMKREKRKEDILIITHIFPTSITGKEQIFEPYSVISKVNNKKVYDLNSLSKALISTVKKNKREFITIELMNNSLMIYDLNQLVQEEIQSSKMYSYPITPIGQYFIQKYIANLEKSKKVSLRDKRGPKKH